mmetsp:Transcript_14377/g.29361  ORF Transcript_14377/g.29361 Transcript_14377/m.29361 type:complete len:110 (+) Transcript_14377:967-1296(+)
MIAATIILSKQEAAVNNTTRQRFLSLQLRSKTAPIIIILLSLVSYGDVITFQAIHTPLANNGGKLSFFTPPSETTDNNYYQQSASIFSIQQPSSASFNTCSLPFYPWWQ